MDVTTQRLRIRDLVADDFFYLHRWRSDPEVTRFMEFGPQPATEEGSRDFLSWCVRVNGEAPRGSHQCAITLPGSEEPIGWIGIGAPDPEKTHVGELDFGYALGQNSWGKGYASEALSAVLQFGFIEMGARKIFGECRTGNVRSFRVMEKAGMEHKGRSPWDPNSELFVVRRLPKGVPAR